MSFDINQLGPLGATSQAEPVRDADVAERANGNGHKANGVQAAATAPLRNGALKREVLAANETVGDLIDLTRRLRFAVDEQSGAVVVQVVDVETGESIKQIPGDQFLDLHERLDEIRFLLVDDVG